MLSLRYLVAAKTYAAVGKQASRSGWRLGAHALFLLVFSTSVLSLLILTGVREIVPRYGFGGPFVHATTLDLPYETVKSVTWVSVITSAGGLIAGLTAVRRGWRPPVRWLLAVGAVTAAVLTILPPTASIDILNYAIYGRITDLGRDPWTMTPEQLWATGDPVGLLRPLSWRRQPAVYGPVAIFVQWLAAILGGASMGWIIFWLKAINAICFVAIGLLLDRMVAGDTAHRVRAALLWTLNPFMLLWVVSGGHADLLAVLPLIGAIYVLRRLRHSRTAGFVGGGLAATAAAVKVTFAVPAAGLLLANLRRPLLVVTGAAGAALLLLVCYLPAGSASFSSLSNRLSHRGDLFWDLPAGLLLNQALLTAVTGATMLGIAALMLWRLPAAYPGLEDSRPMLALAIASVLASPVQYPWYDAMLFPLLALMPTSRFDLLLIIRATVIGGIALPGVRLSVHQYETLRWVVPILTLGCILAALPPKRRLDAVDPYVAGPHAGQTISSKSGPARTPAGSGR